MKHPTALITYNRPGHTARVLEQLKVHRVEPLFVFSDGSKGQTDVAAIGAVRRLIGEIDWTHPVVITRSSNIGLEDSIVNAVDRVLEQYETVIMLEDDCVPGPYFFKFMTQCLERYVNDERVMSIGGYTMPLGPAAENYPHDIYFHPRIETWGWATWRRAWRHYERDVKSAYERALKAGIDLSQGGTDVPGMIQRYVQGRLNAWSTGWLLAVYLRRGYCVYPVESHVQNIGFDGSGVHCSATSRFDSPICQRKPSRFPDKVTLYAPIVRRVKEFYS